MKNYLFPVFLGGLLSLIPDTSAQTPFLKPHQLFRGKEEYNIEVIYQAPKGWMWFGTDHGLFRFDGINYARYSASEGLADDLITAIKCTQQEVMWIGHKTGKITIYDGNTFFPFSPEEGLGDIEISDIETDSAGVVWYSTLGEGVFRFDGRYLTNLNTDDGISDNYVYDIEIDDNGVIWFATDNGITRFAHEKCEIISMKDGLNDNIVRVIKSSPDGRLWVGTEEKGLSVYNQLTRSFIAIDGWDFGAITGFTMTLEDDIWISTERQGVIQLKITEPGIPLYRRISEKEGLISNRLSTIIKDREENIWIGGRQGIIQSLPPAFEFLNKSNGTPFEMAVSIVKDKQQNLWVCSESGLFRGIPDNTGKFVWSNISEKLNIKKINFISLFTDRTGLLWAGTYGNGVYRINTDNLAYSKFTAPQYLNDNNVISISGNDSLIWFSTLGGGVSCFDINKSGFSGVKYPDLENSYIYSARTDNSGRTWIAGSLKYPAYIKNDSLHLINNEKLRFPQLYSIASDSSGGIWFNTGEKGIIRISPDSSYVLGEADGISFDKIESIIFDRLNNLLVISNSGFIFYSPEKGVILELGENSGLSYQSPLLNSVYADKEGQIWIGTETGLIIYNPDYLKFIGQNPRVFLSVRNLFYNPIKPGRSRFRYNENNFTFGYTGIWFSNPEGLTYRYKLEGYDLEWLYSNRNQTLTYSQLPAGNYTFKVEVSLDNKLWYIAEDSTYSFIVRPPFWKQWWFISAMFILIISGIYWYIRQRVSKLEHTKKILELEVERRTEEIRNKNTELETQKEEIQSSIRYAHRIQTAVLPPKKQLDNILKEYFILNKPRDIVSGDFYWIAQNSTHIFFSVGDCTGHGVPGSFMSMLGISALNEIVKSLQICKASTVLNLLRERIQESLHQDGDRELTTYDGMDIGFCVMDPGTNTIQFSAAHNPLYLIRDGEINIYPADKIDIGRYSAEKTEFTNHLIKCQKGDMLYLFTDGYADQFGGSKGRKYKSQRFRDFLVSIHSESMEEQRNKLNEEIENWRGVMPQIDDILVMGIKIT